MDKIKDKIREKMLKTVQSFYNDIKGIRTDRASTSLLDGIIVNIYGKNQKLNQISDISIVNNKTIFIKVWDINILDKIKNAILSSNLNLNPIIEKNNIRILLPDLTEETRKKLAKLMNNFAENSRIAIRNIRRDVIEEIEKMQKNRKISKDELRNAKKEIQNITNDNIKKIDNRLSIKQKDILKY